MYKKEVKEREEAASMGIIHGHHLVQNTLPQTYSEVVEQFGKALKDLSEEQVTWLKNNGRPDLARDWYIGKTHDHLKKVIGEENFNIVLSIGEAGNKAANEMAKKGIRPPNLTLAINDGVTHSAENTKYIYDKMRVLDSASDVSEKLTDIGDMFINGVRTLVD